MRPHRPHVASSPRAATAPTDSLDGVEADPADEHPQTAEEPPLRLGQQVVAPADGRLQTLLPLGQVRCLRSQQLQPVPQPPRERRQREHVQPGGGQLQRQRQPVQLRDQLGYQRRLLLRRGQSRPGAPAPG